ncbi:MAG: inorganic phosphate transporter [Armatimonadota bacterium]
MPDPFLIVVVVMALAFDFINGFHDTANAIATSVLTKALTISTAILMAASLNFVGALLSHKVADTVGKGIVDPAAVTHGVVLAALIGAIIWNLITWYYGLPSSSSHALIGGIVGATALSQFSSSNQAGVLSWSMNYGIFRWHGIEKTLLGLVLSPLVGYVCGFLLMVLLLWLFRRATPWKLNSWFRWLQVGSAGFMALSHGSNDAQKSMGIITMALVATGTIPAFAVPMWVKISCAAAMALGTAFGGWRIIRTIGRNVMELKFIHGFAAETAAATVISAATAFGAPISTTHVISSSIMGVSSSRRLSSVRWKIAGNIVRAWVLTIPASALMAMIAYWMMGWFGYR